VPDPQCVEVAPSPTPPASYAEAVNTLPSHLADEQFEYVWLGGQHTPLAAPYAGPYKVESKEAKKIGKKISDDIPNVRKSAEDYINYGREIPGRTVNKLVTFVSDEMQKIAN